MHTMSSLALVFPGQGAQSVGMMTPLAGISPLVRSTFDEAGTVLGQDLWTLVSTGPESQLNRTEFTQPAMLTAGVATYRVWREAGGPQPAHMAGHSLGEVTALVCAGMLGFEEALRLVAERARLMQAAVPEGEGAMAAIVGLDEDQVSAVCAASAGREVLSPVNFNSPGQVVIAGHRVAVERAVAAAAGAGAKLAKLLPVSVPSHCALMQPAADRLSEKIATVTFTESPVRLYQNVSARCAQNVTELRAGLVTQIASPVRWVETIHNMVAAGVALIVECGPGKVLTGLNKRIVKGVATLPVTEGDSLAAALKAVHDLAGQRVGNLEVAR